MNVSIGDYVLVEKVGIIRNRYEGCVGKVIGIDDEEEWTIVVIEFEDGERQNAWLNKTFGEPFDELRVLAKKEKAVYLL